LTTTVAPCGTSSRRKGKKKRKGWSDGPGRRARHLSCYFRKGKKGGKKRGKNEEGRGKEKFDPIRMFVAELAMELRPVSLLPSQREREKKKGGRRLVCLNFRICRGEKEREGGEGKRCEEKEGTVDGWPGERALPSGTVNWF